ncbi:transposase [Streptomyces sp. NPDC021093]|uniref:transposase n=1 Tax=Streptomyces sp. NPDC021093 TaxID=3365112 RepID=UPI0037A11A1D
MLIEPLLPPWPERSPGPRPVPDRLCLQGLLYVLYHDVAWQHLPLELGFGSGQTCWRRLGRWQQAGVFDQMHRILLATGVPDARCRRSGCPARGRAGPGCRGATAGRARGRRGSARAGAWRAGALVKRPVWWVPATAPERERQGEPGAAVQRGQEWRSASSASLGVRSQISPGTASLLPAVP